MTGRHASPRRHIPMPHQLSRQLIPVLRHLRHRIDQTINDLARDHQHRPQISEQSTDLLRRRTEHSWGVFTHFTGQPYQVDAGHEAVMCARDERGECLHSSNPAVADVAAAAKRSEARQLQSARDLAGLAERLASAP